jgi:hypothetical protein
MHEVRRHRYVNEELNKLNYSIVYRCNMMFYQCVLLLSLLYQFASASGKVCVL